MRKAFLVLALFVLVACGREAAQVDPTTSPSPETGASASPDASADGTSGPSAEPSSPDEPSATATSTTGPSNPSYFNSHAAMGHVHALSVDIGYRQAGTDGDRRGADYIEAQLKKLGWKTRQQSFPLPQGGTSTNVIGDPPGFTTDEPYLMVGGHHDSLRGPGANDNATGIAGSLEIARAVDERRASLPVRFVAFGAEERQPADGRPHHIGSVYYVSKMTETERKNLVSYVNLDMIGHGDLIRCGTLATGPREGTERCLRVAKELDIAAQQYVAPNYSDHGSFQEKGMNTTWLWTGELDCCYHNPRDTYDVVRRADVGRSGKLALAIIRSYSER